MGNKANYAKFIGKLSESVKTLAAIRPCVFKRVVKYYFMNMYYPGDLESLGK